MPNQHTPLGGEEDYFGRSARPTMDLRVLRVHVNIMGAVSVIQQRWEFSDGESEWRSLPVVEFDSSKLNG